MLAPRECEHRLEVRRQGDPSNGPRRRSTQPNHVARKETAENDEHFRCRGCAADADARAHAVRHPRRRRRVWSLSSVRYIDRSSEARVSPSPFSEGRALQSVIQITDSRSAALYA